MLEGGNLANRTAQRGACARPGSSVAYDFGVYVQGSRSREGSPRSKLVPSRRRRLTATVLALSLLECRNYFSVANPLFPDAVLKGSLNPLERGAARAGRCLRGRKAACRFPPSPLKGCVLRLCSRPALLRNGDFGAETHRGGYHRPQKTPTDGTHSPTPVHQLVFNLLDASDDPVTPAIVAEMWPG